MITLTLLVIFLVMLTAAIFVAKSAEARGMNAVGWGIGAFLFTIIAVPLYLIVRKPITSEIGRFSSEEICPAQAVVSRSNQAWLSARHAASLTPPRGQFQLLRRARCHRL